MHRKPCLHCVWSYSWKGEWIMNPDIRDHQHSVIFIDIAKKNAQRLYDQLTFDWHGRAHLFDSQMEIWASEVIGKVEKWHRNGTMSCMSMKGTYEGAFFITGWQFQLYGSTVARCPRDSAGTSNCGEVQYLGLNGFIWEMHNTPVHYGICYSVYPALNSPARMTRSTLQLVKTCRNPHKHA